MSRDVTLELDEYERDNLLWLLRVAARIGLSTGDWLHQIKFKLKPELGDGNPNYPAGVTADIVEALRGRKP